MTQEVIPAQPGTVVFNTLANAPRGIPGQLGFDLSTSLYHYFTPAFVWAPFPGPRGQLACPQTTVSETLIGATERTIPNLSATLTMVANRRVKFTRFTPDFNAATMAGDIFGVRIRDSILGVIQEAVIRVVSGIGVTQANESSVVLTPSAGAHTYSVTMLRLAGTGTVSHSAASYAPGFLLIEDIGAA